MTSTRLGPSPAPRCGPTSVSASRLASGGASTTSVGSPSPTAIELARRHFKRSVELARGDPGGEWLLPPALAALAPVLATAGEPQQAVRGHERGPRAGLPFDARAVLAMALSRAVEVSVLAADDDTAATTLVELRRLLRDLGTRRWVADALGMAAVVLKQQARRDQRHHGHRPGGVDCAPGRPRVARHAASIRPLLPSSSRSAHWRPVSPPAGSRPIRPTASPPARGRRRTRPQPRSAAGTSP